MPVFKNILFSFLYSSFPPAPQAWGSNRMTLCIVHSRDYTGNRAPSTHWGPLVKIRLPVLCGDRGGCYSLVFFTPFYHGPEGARPSQCLYRKHRWLARRCGAGTGVHGNVNVAGARDSRCVRRLPYAVYQVGGSTNKRE